MTIEIQDKTELEVTSELLANVPDTYQKNAGYLIWDLMRAIISVFITLWQKLQYLCAFFNIENLEYDDLVKFVLQRRGIVAKTETYANGLITVTNGNGTITIGDKFETESGLEFEAIETKEVETNDSFMAQCTTAGAVGNVPIGAITVIPTTITGIVSITNLTAFEGGYEKETKESIIKRYLTALREPIASGNIYHYKKWALEVTGVGNVDVKPLWNGDNTVKVIIVDSNNEPASASLVLDVQNYIDPNSHGTGEGQAPMGAYCTVTSADAKIINVTADITLNSGVNADDVKNAVKDSIENYIKSTVFVDDYVSYARVGASILSVEGVRDYDNLLLNDSNDNITLSNTLISREIALTGSVILTVV